MRRTLSKLLAFCIEQRSEQPVLHAAECIFDPARAEPSTAVTPSALTEEENREEEEARVARGPELFVIAVDPHYPIIPSIRALLPDDERHLKRVLSNPVAARAIMHLSDCEFSQSIIRAHGAQADRFTFIMLEGLPYKLTESELSVLDLKRWAKMRDMPVGHLREGSVKRAIWSRLKYALPEVLSNARARIANVVKEIQSVE